VDEESFVAGEEDQDHVILSGGNLMGNIYGAPSFLSGRVVEQGVGSPVEGARVVVIGLSRPAMETTNVGGWFNIAENSQPRGRYLIIAFMGGYGIATESVFYKGEPLKVTIEMAKR
jgi:hypothetical protein